MKFLNRLTALLLALSMTLTLLCAEASAAELSEMSEESSTVSTQLELPEEPSDEAELVEPEVVDEVPDEAPEAEIVGEVPDEIPEPEIVGEVPDEIPEPEIVDEVPDEPSDEIPDKPTSSLQTFDGQSGNLSWTFRNSVLTVSGSGPMGPFSNSNPPPWYSEVFDYWIDSVVVEEGITSVGDYAFNGLAVRNVSLPDSLTSIGYGAFAECSYLSSITIPASVTSIGDFAFAYDPLLSQVFFRGNAPSIQPYAFQSVTASAYYPKGNSSWASSRNNYGGSLSWRTWSGDPDVPILPEVEPPTLSNTANGVKITWKSLPNAASYRIYRKGGGVSSYQAIKTVAANTTSYTDASVKSRNATKYVYVVRASFLQDGEEVWSDYNPAGTAIVRLTAPQLTGLSYAKNGKVNVKWGKVNSVTGYLVQYANNKNFSNAKKSYFKGASGVSRTLSGLSGQTYYVRVRTYRTNNGTNYYSSWSNVKSVFADLRGTLRIGGTLNYSYAYQVLNLLNKERTSRGLKKLTMDRELLSAAMLRAAEATLFCEATHTRPNGTSALTVSEKAHGENMAAGQKNPKQVMSAWMGSSGHRANILTADYQSVGVGCFYHNGTYFWIQVFSRDKGSAVSQPKNKNANQTVTIQGDKIKVMNQQGKTQQMNKYNIKLKGSTSIQRKKSTTLSVTVTSPCSFITAKPSVKSFTWTSSNPKVAKVSNGKVTGVSKGKAKITAKTGSYQTSITITVR